MQRFQCISKKYAQFIDFLFWNCDVYFNGKLTGRLILDLFIAQSNFTSLKGEIKQKQLDIVWVLLILSYLFLHIYISIHSYIILSKSLKLQCRVNKLLTQSDFSELKNYVFPF